VKLVRFRKRFRDKLLSFFNFVDGSDILSTIFGRISSRPSPKSKHHVPAEWLRDLILQSIERLKETYTNPFPTHSSLHEEFVTVPLTHISESQCTSCVTAHITNGEVFRDQPSSGVSMARDVCIFPLS
jgi:hypothetical protein